MQSGVLIWSLRTAYCLIAEHQDKWHAYPNPAQLPLVQDLVAKVLLITIWAIQMPLAKIKLNCLSPEMVLIKSQTSYEA